MEKYFWSIIVIIIVIVIAITTTIYAINVSSEDANLNSKAENEIKYISKEIINMVNGLNNISYSNSALQEKKENLNNLNSQTSENEKNKTNETKETNIKYTAIENGILNTNISEINWDYLKNNCEKLYSVWTTTIIDLHSLNVSNEDILNFSSQLDIVTLSIKSEDKIASVNNLVALYGYIPRFLEQINSEKQKITIENTKICILNSYAYIEENKWNEADEQISNAINIYSEIINNVQEKSEYSKNRKTKIYVLLNELYNSNYIKDKEIYYLKYKRVMEELSNLE